MTPLRYQASFDASELSVIQRGLQPQSSDDKWFVYWHDDQLWVHRSWTGFLIYTMTFRLENGRHVVATAQVSTDRAQYGGQPEEDEQLFVDWLLRNLVLGDESVEMPIPAALRDSASAPGDSTEESDDSEDVEGDQSRPLGDAWSRVAGVANKLARPLLRRLTRLRPRLTNSEVEAIVAKHIRGRGLNWVPRIEYISEPPVAFVSVAHEDPNHDFLEADPFFVDLADGLVTEQEWHHIKRGWDAAAKVAPMGPDATNEWIERLLTDPANRERWVQICLSGTRWRYRFLPAEF